jgi:ABC-type phosphate transport system substrate-binding protein
MEVSALRRALGSVLVSVLALAVLATGAAQVVSADAPFRVIVHPQVKGSQIPRAALTSIFLKQAPKWGDGSAVLPVDQSLRSPVRKVFSNDVLQQGLVEVQMYWHRRMATGTTPPPVKTSDQEIVSFVASTPGAIGYVSGATPLPDSVKTIEITN